MFSFSCLLQNKSAADYIEASKARISQYEKEVNIAIVLDHSECTGKCLLLPSIHTGGKSTIRHGSCAGHAMWQSWLNFNFMQIWSEAICQPQLGFKIGDVVVFLPDWNIYVFASKYLFLHTAPEPAFFFFFFF